MQRLTFIKPCIIMGINQKNIARNETNYIIEFLMIGNLLLIRNKYLLCNNKIFVYTQNFSYTNSYLTIVYIRKA